MDNSFRKSHYLISITMWVYHRVAHVNLSFTQETIATSPIATRRHDMTWRTERLHPVHQLRLLWVHVARSLLAPAIPGLSSRLRKGSLGRFVMGGVKGLLGWHSIETKLIYVSLENWVVWIESLRVLSSTYPPAIKHGWETPELNRQ